ncbi:MAG: glycosyltransferase family 2 protein [Solirubrobacterales bacterium]|nr:glycosyltransferase family 2 protein [Solirubrobacterales bacterium]
MALATATVYIPTLDGGERLAACLDALAAQSVQSTVVVADNGPGDGCRPMLESSFPDVVRIGFGGRNLGFGTALNRAVAAHGEGPVILLNDDARPAPAFVENLLASWDRGRVAMVAAVLLQADDPSRIDSAGIICDQTLTAWDYLTGEPADRLEFAPPPLGPTGGGALFDRGAFEALGGFDERIFLYYEDLDLALRMRLAGHECRLATDAMALHDSSATLGRRAGAKYRQTGFGRGYLLRKYGIMRHPSLALKTVVSDGTAALAQAIADRTLAGTKGRIEGWRAGASTERLEPPVEALVPARLGRQFAVRLNRRRR